VNVGTLISRAARWYSNKTAVVCAGKERTFIEIDENSNRFANSLAKLGLVKGDRVALYADNSVEYFEAVFGLFKSGIVGVGVNTMLSAKEAAFIIKDSGARVVVTSSRVAGGLSLMKSQLPAVEKILCIGQAPEGMVDYHEFIKKQSPSPPNVQVEEDDLAQLFYSGGTTGVPKGAMITHRIVNNVIMNMQADFCHVTHTDVALSPGSLAHGNGYYCLLFFIEGVKTIIPEGYVPEDILSTIERERVTVLPGYPTTLVRLIDYPDVKKYDLSSIRLITYGAAPLATEKVRKAMEIFGNKLAQGYGQAEALFTITFLTPEDHAFALAERLTPIGVNP
jgi:acyl-CoA synthetase (AMP-forming)/AMP-acid ligase II